MRYLFFWCNLTTTVAITKVYRWGLGLTRTAYRSGDLIVYSLHLGPLRLNLHRSS